MSEVKRYTESCGEGGGVVAHRNGEFVEFKELDAALAREAALREELERFKREAEQDTTIDERDRYHEMADSLALAISQHFRVEIGEHSSMNCPWSVALEVLNGAYITDTNEGRDRDALQQRLTAAERRLSTFESLMLESNELLYVIQDGLGPNLGAEVETMRGKVFTALKQSGGHAPVKHYECIDKGGDYTVVAIAAGAGTLKGFNHYVYKNADGVHFVRDPEDFLSRMKVKPAEGGGS